MKNDTSIYRFHIIFRVYTIYYIRCTYYNYIRNMNAINKEFYNQRCLFRKLNAKCNQTFVASCLLDAKEGKKQGRKKKCRKNSVSTRPRDVNLFQRLRLISQGEILLKNRATPPAPLQSVLRSLTRKHE